MPTHLSAAPQIDCLTQTEADAEDCRCVKKMQPDGGDRGGRGGGGGGGGGGDGGGGGEFKPEENCIVDGTYDWGRPKDGRRGIEFGGAEYFAFSAAKKEEQLWDRLTEKQEVVCQKIGGPDGLPKHFHQNPNMSFGVTEDSTPGRNETRRIKFVHQQGMVAKMRYKNTGGHNYTGFFEDGADHGIVRISDAHIDLRDTNGNPIDAFMQPSIAVKMLRDGMHSGNYLGMVSFEDGGTGFDFFSKPFINHLPQFEGECGPYSIARFHEQANMFHAQNGNHQLATHGQDGKAIRESSVQFPWQLRFDPIERNLPKTDGRTRFFD